jgi:hypothetical protein
MTAKEKLRAAIERLSESEAEDTLDFLARRHNEPDDALDELLHSAPVDDEPTTTEEEAAVQAARGQITRGETVSLDEIRRELA